MPNIVRRWTYDPGNTVLTQIEGVDIIDNTPPQQVIGVNTGLACIVGEFENGPFNTVTQVTSFTQMKSTFGTFGYTYGNTVGNNPCARQRFADGAVLAEYWNGNGAAQLNGKAFAQLCICRVNTSVGTVQFTRQANLVGGSQFRYSLLTGQVLAISIDGGGAVNATFTGVAATVTGTGAAFGSITAGLSATFTVDQNVAFTVVFQTGDTTIANVISRINSFAGFTFASNSAGQLKLTGIQAGTGGQIIIGAGGSALTDLGLTAATTNGTGNVSNISAVAPAELNTVVHAAVSTANVELLPTGQIRMYRTSSTPATDSIALTAATTATGFSFPIGVTDAAAVGNAGTIPAGTVVQVPSGNVYVTMQDVNVTSATQTGVTPSGAGPYPVVIRFAQDDNSGSTVATAGTITQVTNPILLDSFACTNLLPTTAALSESAIDAAYTTAILATLQSSNQVAQGINILWSARQSNSVRNQLLQNVNTVGSGGGAGVVGRMACIRPPIGTLASQAESSTLQPGVGAYTTERIIYNYPGVTTTISAIQTVGSAGGTGFSIPGQAIGTASIGSDGFMASILSQLNPEQNPGQLTSYTTGAVGFEVTSAGTAVNNGVPFALQDYINFKANGIAAPTFTNGVMQFQSGVTSVLYASYPSQAPIHRRRMADYIQDSLAIALQPFVKQLMTINRQAAATLVIQQFLIGLLSPTNSNSQRINGFYLDTKTPNLAPPGGVAPTTLGLWRATILVQTIPSMDDIVLDTTIGDSVNVNLAN